MLEMFVIEKTSIWPSFILIVLRIQKKQASNFHCSNAYDDITDFKICEFKKEHQNLDMSRTKQYFFLQIKKFINYTSRAILLQKIVL